MRDLVFCRAQESDAIGSSLSTLSFLTCSTTCDEASARYAPRARLQGPLLFLSFPQSRESREIEDLTFLNFREL